jgi:hypothetical protein
VFRRTWQRPPTEAELDGLVEGYVREEEVPYREAVPRGDVPLALLSLNVGVAGSGSSPSSPRRSGS